MTGKIVARDAKEVVAHGLRTMGVDFGGEKSDGNTKVKIVGAGGSVVTVGAKDYRYYPWGKNNRLPGENLDLLRSNANMQNLLKTRADFLFGAGIGIFKYVQDGNDLVMVPVFNSDLLNFYLEKEIDFLADEFYTNYCELANGWIDVDVDKAGEITLKGLDSSVVRTVIPDDNRRVKHYLVSTKWDGYGKKEAALFPAFEYGMLSDGGNLPMSSFIHVKPVQPGQFYYGHSGWTALKPWIDLDNRIPVFHNNALDTEGNIGMIIRAAKNYFTDMVGKYQKDDGSDFMEEELQEEFDEAMQNFLFGDGKRKTITDICGYDPIKGQIQKYIEFEPVKKGVTGEEYIKLNGNAISAMSNGSQVLSGLSGVADNKMNSGGGTEIRISAEYQQFYRTPRERNQFITILNKIYRPMLLKKKFITEDMFFSHKNILLQTLNVNKKGVADVADAAA
jgi:hypothetical protein